MLKQRQPVVRTHLRGRSCGKPTGLSIAWIECGACGKVYGEHEGPTLSLDGATP
jgi:hypothetical protein